MKKSMKKNRMKTFQYKWIALMLGGLCLVSCHDEEKQEPEISEEEYQAQVLEAHQHDTMRILVDNLTYTDPAPSEESVVKMGYGIRLDKVVAPTVYTMGVEDFKEAKDVFLSSIMPSGLDSLYTEEETCAIDFGTYGNATFQKNKSGGALLATLDLSLDTIPHITQLRFVRKDAIPADNAQKTFTRGQIVQDEKDKNRKYICVSSISQGNPCRLICLNRTYDEMVTQYNGTQIFTNCIDLGTAKSLRAFLKESYPLWEKAEKVYFKKYAYTNEHDTENKTRQFIYMHEGEWLHWTKYKNGSFTSAKKVKWIFNTNYRDKSKRYYLILTYNYTEYEFSWYDYETGKIEKASTDNNERIASYSMPEAIAISWVALDEIDESRWTLVDNINANNYNNFPEK